MEEAGQRQIEGGVHVRQPAKAGPSHRGSVIATQSADDLLLFRLPQNVVVIPDDLDLCVVGIGAGASEEDPAHIARRQRNEPVGQSSHRLVGHRGKRVVVGQPPGLLGGRVYDFVSSVADIDTP